MPEGDDHTYITIEIGVDFNTIGDAIDYLNNLADTTSWYRLYIPNGTYNENTLTLTRGNVLIEGEDKYDTIIYVDGLADPDTPESAKHCLKVGVNCIVQNLTLKTQYTKYCLHQDAISGAYKATFNDVLFRKGLCTNTGFAYCVGVGAGSGQYNEFNNCEFLNENTNATAPLYGFIWHNWGNSTTPCGMTVNNGNFINCGIGIFGELNSNITGHDDIVLNNCTAIPNGVKVYFDTANGRLIPDVPVIDQPYRIRIRCNNYFDTLELVDRSVYKYLSLASCAYNIV